MMILISTYACEPGLGSEPGIGWNWAVQAAKHHIVWMVTRANNRDAIENELHKRPVPHLQFIYHDLPRWSRWWKRGNRGVNFYYFLWQLTALSVVRLVHEREHFDVAHHVTLGSMRHVSFLAWLGVPYIWGPVGGGERAPLGFYRSFGVRGLISELVRDASIHLTRVDPMVQATARNARVILAPTDDTRRDIRPRYRDKTRVKPAMGASMQQANQDTYHSGGSGPFRAVFVGRLIHWKGVQLAIAAVAEARLRGRNIELSIIGIGPFKSALTNLSLG